MFDKRGWIFVDHVTIRPTNPNVIGTWIRALQKLALKFSNHLTVNETFSKGFASD